LAGCPADTDEADRGSGGGFAPEGLTGDEDEDDEGDEGDMLKFSAQV
jgi:hypothetical protein